MGKKGRSKRSTDKTPKTEDLLDVGLKPLEKKKQTKISKETSDKRKMEETKETSSTNEEAKPESKKDDEQILEGDSDYEIEEISKEVEKDRIMKSLVNYISGILNDNVYQEIVESVSAEEKKKVEEIDHALLFELIGDTRSKIAYIDNMIDEADLSKDEINEITGLSTLLVLVGRISRLQSKISNLDTNDWFLMYEKKINENKSGDSSEDESDDDEEEEEDSEQALKNQTETIMEMLKKRSKDKKTKEDSKGKKKKKASKDKDDEKTILTDTTKTTKTGKTITELKKDLVDMIVQFDDESVRDFDFSDFEYVGFDPVDFYDLLKSISVTLGETDADFNNDMTTLVAIAVGRGLNTTKIKDKTEEAGKKKMEVLFAKYSVKTSGTQNGKDVVLLSRFPATFPSIAAVLLKNGKVTPAHVSDEIPMYLQFSGGPSLIQSKDSELYNKWLKWAIAFDKVVNTKKKPDEAKVKNFGNISWNSNLLSDEARKMIVNNLT